MGEFCAGIRSRGYQYKFQSNPMNYFDYNLTRSKLPATGDSPFEVLTFDDNVSIEVDEDHTVTVDDIRAYIRELDTRRSGPVSKGSNVVKIRVA